jgi:hypothetical protein
MEKYFSLVKFSFQAQLFIWRLYIKKLTGYSTKKPARTVFLAG